MKRPVKMGAVHYILSTVFERNAVCGVSYAKAINNPDDEDVWDFFDNNPSKTTCPYCKATKTWKEAILARTLKGENQ